MTGTTTIAAHQAAFRQGQLIRVVNYHSTPLGDYPILERELTDYAEAFAPVTLDDLDALFETGEWHKDKPGLIPVFYEGYRNSATVAAPICDKLGLTAWFPVATQFLSTSVEHQETFARAHWIYLVEEDLRGERIAMTWDELKQLSERHVVFPHTASHEGFDTILDDADLAREVVEPKARMDAVTGQDAPAFAWLHGSAYGRSPIHDRALVQAGYRYLFSNTMIQRLPTS
jgi:Polysaccharide deacetylase